jgi:hypothetical protein
LGGYEPVAVLSTVNAVVSVSDLSKKMRVASMSGSTESGGLLSSTAWPEATTDLQMPAAPAAWICWHLARRQCASDDDHLVDQSVEVGIAGRVVTATDGDRIVAGGVDHTWTSSRCPRADRRRRAAGWCPGGRQRGDGTGRRRCSSGQPRRRAAQEQPPGGVGYCSTIGICTAAIGSRESGWTSSAENVTGPLSRRWWK